MELRILLFAITCHLSFYVFTTSEKFICTSEQTIYLDQNKLYFIETPNFPQSMNEACKITFIPKIKNSDEFIRFVMTNGILTNATFTFTNETYSTEIELGNHVHDHDFVFDSDQLKFEIDRTYQYNAFQGYIYLLTRKSQCSLNFFNDSSPLSFQDETELVYITNYYSWEAVPRNCTWNFNAPFGYKFKLQVLYINFPHGATQSQSLINFKVDDLTQIINSSYYSTPHDAPFILELYGKNLSISFQLVLESYQLFSTYFDFKFVVSVTKIVPIVTEENCTVTKITNGIIWTNINEKMLGYSNNARCSLNITIPWKDELLIFANITNYQSPDKINVFINNKLKDVNFHELNNNRKPLYFQAKEDGFGSNAIFEFVSDGNTQLQGFQLTFIERECNCGHYEILVPCTEEHTYNIMNNEDAHFCDNLRCSFIIKVNSECQHKNLLLKIPAIWKFNNTYDLPVKIDVFSDNKNIFSTDTDSNVYDVLLVSGRKNIFNFSSFDHGYFAFSLESVDPIKILPKIILNENHSIEFLNQCEMPSNSAVTVELNDLLVDDVLQFFSSEYQFTLYTDESFTLIYRKKFNTAYAGYSVINMVLKTKSLTFYSKQNYSNIVVFRALKTHTRNCALTSNILPGNRRHTMLSNSQGSCEMIINHPHTLKHLWTSATNPVTILTASEKQLISFNKNDAHLWKDAELPGEFCRIVIPPNESIIVDTSNEYGGRFLYYQSKTLYSSSFYGEYSPRAVKEKKFLHTNLTITLKVLDLNISKSGFLTINDQTINTAGQIFEFQMAENSIEISYNETELGFYGYLIEVETKND